MAKEVKALKKKDFNLSAFKASKKLDDGVKEKPLEWIKLSSAFHKATGLPGFPKGYVSTIRGHSNTGKSTALMEAVLYCQKQGILPVIIDTENSWSWDRAKIMGIEFDDVVDEDTGEVVNYDGFFIYINNEHLIENYGKKHIKKALEATVEDVAEFCNDMLANQAEGDLPYELCFFFDSIGTLNCRKTIESESNNNMWVAGAYSSAFKALISHKIPASRKENKQYTNTFVAVQKIWMQANLVGQPTVKHSGGDFWWFNPRVIFHIGGHATNSLKNHSATSGGKSYIIGTETKIATVKYQLTYDGTPLTGNSIVSTPHGFVAPDEINDYKKDNRQYILDKLKAGEEALIEYKSEGDVGNEQIPDYIPEG